MEEEKKANSITLKVMVDKERNRVVFVESDHVFVDLLFSFLTLPMGTLIRLTQNIDEQSSSNEIGCFNNLYKSVEALDPLHFSAEECKKMLLLPRRASEGRCSNLKLSIDDSEPTNLYSCDCKPFGCSERRPMFITTASSCTICSRKLQVRYLKDDMRKGDGVFVKGAMNRYIISDDLQVHTGTLTSSLSLFGKHKIKHWSCLEERDVILGLEETLYLLSRSLISRTPLTDVILFKGELPETVKVESGISPNELRVDNDISSADIKVNVKILRRKSNNKVLYAEANQDFLDFIFSFLTFPLGSVMNLCGGNLSIGCVDNLYKSVTELSTQGAIISEEMLVSPKLAPHFGCMSQPLRVVEEDPEYVYCYSDSDWYLTKRAVAGSNINISNTGLMINPKLVNRGTTSGGGFMSDGARFMVMDNLMVTPLSITSGLSFIRSQNVPFDDIDEHNVSIGEQQALNILKASLVSDKALSAIFVPPC